MSGGSSAKEDGAHRLGFREGIHLHLQCVEVAIDEMILPCRDCKIAVAAVMSAKRHVHVGSVRPKPGRLRTVQGNSPVVSFCEVSCYDTSRIENILEMARPMLKGYGLFNRRDRHEFRTEGGSAGTL